MRSRRGFVSVCGWAGLLLVLVCCSCAPPERRPTAPVYFFDGSMPEKNSKPKREVKTNVSTTNQKKPDWFWWWPWKKSDSKPKARAQTYEITPRQPREPIPSGR